MPATTLSPLEAARCPLCGGGNACAMAEAARARQEPEDCWCMRMPIDPDALARVPPHAQGRACLCVACAAARPVER